MDRIDDARARGGWEQDARFVEGKGTTEDDAEILLLLPEEIILSFGQTDLCAVHLIVMHSKTT